MLFNSYVFLFAFMPLVVCLFFFVGRWSAERAVGLLALASVVFYSWWDVRFTIVLFASVGFNYAVAAAIARARSASLVAAARRLTISGVAGDLLALGYFKYAGFFAAAVGADWTAVALPIGISFFTFTQIAFLVDTFAGKVDSAGTGRVDPVHYLLFVTYFPHLIAGPILHHAEMMPQFRRAATLRPSAEALSVGLVVFVLGLAKKLLLADPFGTYADAAFLPGATLSTPDAWRGVLAYTLQIYFDFSAYCDMAIGVSRMLNIVLPVNFESPYKSLSISDFWRRWHMTLSRFLRDYLYVPLGGNRRGPARRYANLMATMVLGGFWHGAGWTFLTWGLLHGSYLCVHHAWRAGPGRFVRLPAAFSWAFTFLAVMVAWVFFRAADMPGALGILGAMFSPDALSQARGAAASGPRGVVHWLAGDGVQAFALAGGLAAVLLLPNLRQLMDRHRLVLDAARPRHGVAGAWLTWRPNALWASVVVCAFVLSLTRMSRVSQFLYFQF